jgi:hypothetical protein
MDQGAFVLALFFIHVNGTTDHEMCQNTAAPFHQKDAAPG